MRGGRRREETAVCFFPQRLVEQLTEMSKGNRFWKLCFSSANLFLCPFLVQHLQHIFHPRSARWRTSFPKSGEGDTLCSGYAGSDVDLSSQGEQLNGFRWAARPSANAGPKHNALKMGSEILVWLEAVVWFILGAWAWLVVFQALLPNEAKPGLSSSVSVHAWLCVCLSACAAPGTFRVLVCLPSAREAQLPVMLCS